MIVAVGKITLASTSPIHVPRPNGSRVARCQVGGKLSYERQGITVIPAGRRWWWEGGGGGQEWGESGNRSGERRETQGSFVPVFHFLEGKKMITKRHRRFQFFFYFLNKYTTRSGSLWHGSPVYSQNRLVHTGLKIIF